SVTTPKLSCPSPARQECWQRQRSWFACSLLLFAESCTRLAVSVYPRWFSSSYSSGAPVVHPVGHISAGRVGKPLVFPLRRGDLLGCNEFRCPTARFGASTRNDRPNLSLSSTRVRDINDHRVGCITPY